MLGAAANAARLEHDRAMHAAWTTAALYRSEKMPPLFSLLSSDQSPAKRKTMEWQDMLKVAEAWAG